MNTDWFDEWVILYCEATAAGGEVAAALLANRAVILDPPWSATQAELGEITARLVRECRVPKFPNEHTDAIGNELRAVRDERRHAAIPPVGHAPGDFAPDCPACGGSGLAVVPLRACVLDGRVVLNPRTGRVDTGAVLCDRPGCLAGERVQADEGLRKLDDRRPRRPRLSQCERAVGGRDLPAMLREYERAAAVAARKGEPAGPLLPNIEAALAALAARGIRRAA
jgi:hypothetical protein